MLNRNKGSLSRERVWKELQPSIILKEAFVFGRAVRSKYGVNIPKQVTSRPRKREARDSEHRMRRRRICPALAMSCLLTSQRVGFVCLTNTKYTLLFSRLFLLHDTVLPFVLKSVPPPQSYSYSITTLTAHYAFPEVQAHADRSEDVN